MKSRTWLRDALEEFSYKTYITQYPEFVELIRNGIVAGESPKKIKDFVSKAAGANHQLTGNIIGHLIDHVSKQINN